jgi:hypothetical protein
VSKNSEPTQTVPPSSKHPQSARAPQSRPPASRRSTWPAAGPKRRTRAPSKATKKPARIPVVKRSFVVELLPREKSSAAITARILPAENPATTAVENEFRLSDSLYDVISDLLVKLAREEEE